MDFLFLNSKAHLLLERSASEVSGGAELQVALLARELAARGFATAILHSSEVPGKPAMLSGVECVPVGPFHRGGLSDVARAAGPVFSAIRHRRAKNVLVLGWTAWLFLLWLARPFLRFRLVFICGSDIEPDGTYAKLNGLRGRLFDFAMRRADLRFAMTERQAGMFRARGMECRLYRNLVMPRQVPPSGAKDIDLLWVGRCQEIKGPERFLDLAQALPEARCLMVCPPEDRALFDSVAARARGLGNVELVEFIPYHEIQAVYDRARIVANTSWAEGFANSFIQAGMSRAAILSLSVDCDGVLAKFGAGFCADGDLAAMAERARHWLSEAGSADLDRVAEGAARFVEANHGTEENLGAFLEGVGLSTGRVTSGR